jgi:hypothetical protein
MKKHQLLEKAMRDYPKGTKLTWGFDTFTSTGAFWIDVDEGNDEVLFKHKDTDVCVWNGKDWAAIIPEQPDRKFIMKSEDGVDLYEGDDYYRVCDIGSRSNWTLVTVGGSIESSGKLTRDRNFMVNDRVFSTKEAAEAWIAEQNKPKEIKLFGQNGQVEVIAKADGSIDIKIDSETGIHFSTDYMNQIFNALKSLKS